MSIADIAVIITSTFFVGTLVYISYDLYKEPITSKNP